MRHMSANKMHREKARWELHKNSTNNFEQTPEAAPQETTAVQPFISHFKNYPNKMNTTCDILLKKQGQTHK